MNQIGRLLWALSIVASFAVLAQDENNIPDHGVNLSDKNFPWQLVVDRGKILGCVYDNKFYSLGAILVLESLPRKCELASDRNGLWQQLSEAELLLFQESIKQQQALQREATYIGNEPINEQEARLIRYLRHAKKQADSK